VSDAIEIHCDPECLTLTCGKDDFARLLDLVIAEVGAEKVVPLQRDSLRSIEILAAPATGPVRLRDRVVLLGCYLVGFAMLFLMLVGVTAIARRFR
jgi:hypothetical protein